MFKVVSTSSNSPDGADLDHRGSSPQEDALDITIHEQNNTGLVFWAESEEEKALREEVYSMVIELPQYPHAIVYEDKITLPVTPHCPLRSLVAEGAMTGCVTAIIEDDPSTTLEFSMSNKIFSISSLIATTGTSVVYIWVLYCIVFNYYRIVLDWEIGQDNPCEDQHRKLAHHSKRGSADPSLKPNLQEKQMLDRIVTLPTFGDQLKLDEKDLVFKFRYYLTENKKALTK